MTELRTLENWAGAQRTTLALVFTDIVGSTALGNTMGDERWTEVLIKHFNQARQHIASYDCYEIKIIGDSFMVVFRTAIDALNFSLAFHANTGDPQVFIRAGIHVGPVRIIENDIYGRMVNYTSRIVGAAGGAMIALSGSAKEHIDSELGTRIPNMRFTQFTPDLKDFHEPQVLWKVRTREMVVTINAASKARLLLSKASASSRTITAQTPARDSKPVTDTTGSPKLPSYIISRRKP